MHFWQKIEKIQQEEREAISLSDRAKFLHDTIAAQRKFLAEQRSATIRNKPPTISQLRNQMITYLKHVANKKHAELKSKSFEEIQVLYERYKKQDQTFVAIGTEEDERAIKKMNEKALDKEKKRRWNLSMKKLKRKKEQRKETPDEDKVIDVESLNQQYPIIEWQSFFLTTKPQHDQTKPDEDIYLNKIGFLKDWTCGGNELWEIYEYSLIKVIRQLLGYSTARLEAYQLETTIVHSGVHTIMTSTGLVFHMLVESKYPLTKEVLSQMLELKLETEEESSMALELIKFVRQQLEEFEDSNDDDTVTSTHER
ncbi:hypothetical protein Tco_0340270 [Tanacetum coccineum]